MKARGATIAGLIFLVLGLAVLIHPRFTRARVSDVRIGNQDVRIETRRTIPQRPLLSGLLLLVGGILVYYGTRKF
jgi:uncharacterized membrane protein HdeD (DUF308 family)